MLGLENNSYSHKPEVCLYESMFIYSFTRILLCARQNIQRRRSPCLPSKCSLCTERKRVLRQESGSNSEAVEAQVMGSAWEKRWRDQERLPEGSAQPLNIDLKETKSYPGEGEGAGPGQELHGLWEWSVWQSKKWGWSENWHRKWGNHQAEDNSEASLLCWEDSFILQAKEVTVGF